MGGKGETEGTCMEGGKQKWERRRKEEMREIRKKGGRGRKGWRYRREWVRRKWDKWDIVDVMISTHGV